MKEINFVASCEVCGEVAMYSSRISPDGFIHSVKDGGLIKYQKHYYCSPCLEKLSNDLHNRVKDKW